MGGGQWDRIDARPFKATAARGSSPLLPGVCQSFIWARSPDGARYDAIDADIRLAEVAGQRARHAFDAPPSAVFVDGEFGNRGVPRKPSPG